MLDRRDVFARIQELDGQAAPSGVLNGQVDFGRYQLTLGEDFGDGWTSVGVRLPQIAAAFPPNLFDQPAKRAALEDAVVRRMACEAARFPGLLRVPVPGGQILPRNTVTISNETVQASLEIQAALPGQPFDGARLHRLFSEAIPSIINAGLYYCNHDEDRLQESIDSMHTLVQLRQSLGTRGMIGFVGEGLHLGDSRLVMDEDLLTDVQAGDRVLRGMGIPVGLTVLVGDRYSGRVELMASLAKGIYNRSHGDPAERLVTVQDAVHVASEPGRSIQRVDLRPFVRSVPGGHPERFCCESADEFTSQAAATIEALEAGSRVLLFEESSSSAEFLTGDGGLLDHPRVTPLCAQVESLVRQGGISLVVSGSGAVMAPFISYADRVLGISQGHIHDVTAAAKASVKATASAAPSVPAHEALGTQRWIVPFSIDPSHAEQDIAVSVDGGTLRFGSQSIDASQLLQLASPEQLETIGLVLAFARRRLLTEGTTMRDLLDAIDQTLSGQEGLNVLPGKPNGRLARPRRFEIASILNRLPTLRVSHVGS